MREGLDDNERRKMEIKIQTVLKGEAAEKFAAAASMNHRSIAGEAAFRLEQSLKNDNIDKEEG